MSKVFEQCAGWIAKDVTNTLQLVWTLGSAEHLPFPSYYAALSELR